MILEEFNLWASPSSPKSTISAFFFLVNDYFKRSNASYKLSKSASTVFPNSTIFNNAVPKWDLDNLSLVVNPGISLG